MSRWRRFEVMLPVKFNDGKPIPRKWFGRTALELTDHFGAASVETQTIEGHWLHGGVLYQDKLVRIFVDVPDLAENRRWMKEFKARWKAQLEQLEIWMVSYRIEIE
jgi:hypothetical protein